MNPTQMDLVSYAVEQNKRAAIKGNRKGEVLTNPCRMGKSITISFERNSPLIEGKGRIEVRRSFTQREISKDVVALRIAELRAGSTQGRKVDLIYRDGIYYIVDGQHAYIAHARINHPVEAQLWVSKSEGTPSEDDERELNTVLNMVRPHGPAILYNNHVGPSKAIFEWACSPGGPWAKRAKLKASSSGTIGIPSLVGIAGRATLGSSGRVDTILLRMDAEVEADNAYSSRAKAFLYILADVFTDDKCKTLKNAGVPLSKAMIEFASFYNKDKGRISGKAMNRAKKMVRGWISDPVGRLREVNE